MKYAQYVSLIERLERSAARDPRRYELKVLLLTVLGYAYFIALVLLLIAPVVIVIAAAIVQPGTIGRLLLLTGKIWWALIPGLGIYFGFLGSAVRSITAKVPDPTGREITPAEAPELFRFVDETCRELRARRPAKILVTDTLNAAVVTMPRFGIFGRKVFLLVGLPTMKALTPDQFKAVVAHEIGHISGKHGAFAKWAYQMREAWGRLIESQAEAENKLASLYRKFVDWYFPYFSAYSFVLMRGHEIAADADAAYLVGSRPLGESLVIMEAKSRSIDDEFWPAIQRENARNESPVPQLFSRMIGSLGFVDEHRAAATIEKALAVKTDFEDSHPSLAERLRLIGYWTSGDLPEISLAVETDASEAMLGRELSARLAAEFDEMWSEMAASQWRERYKQLRESEQRIAELEQKRSAGAELTAEEMLELAGRRADHEGIAAALPVLEEAAARFPDAAEIVYSLGCARLSLDNDAGLADIERAIALDGQYRLAGNDVAFRYLRSKGRLDEAMSHAGEIEEQTKIIRAAERERSGVAPGDEFIAHDLPAEFVELVPTKVAVLEEIVAVYAARKVVQHMPEFPFHVLFIELRKKGPLKNRDDADPSTIVGIVRDRLDTGLINYFVTLTGAYAGLKSDLERIPGALIYSRRES
ncbi:MAG: M48 family metalloprotease [Pyrinomonadaceae bacterium]